MTTRLSLILWLIAAPFVGSWAQNPYVPKVLNMRERATVIDQWLEERVQTVLPHIMRRSGIDMWIIIAREYNEDPIIKTLLPATWQSARRTTILIAYDPGEGQQLETFGISRYNTGKIFKTLWNKEEQPISGKPWPISLPKKTPKR